MRIAYIYADIGLGSIARMRYALRYIYTETSRTHAYFLNDYCPIMRECSIIHLPSFHDDTNYAFNAQS